MTAIACAHRAPRARIVCLDGARTIGAKILVSGSARCNLTNGVVIERDFWSGSWRIVRDRLRAFPAPRAAALLEDLGVALHEARAGETVGRIEIPRLGASAIIKAGTDAPTLRLAAGHIPQLA